MKGNSGIGNVVERDEWETPQRLFDIINRQYSFGFDCCANAHNTKCKSYSDKFLGAPVDCVCWMNPPFSKAKEMLERFFNLVKQGVAIYRCDNMEWSMWQEVIFKNASWIFIPKGRTHYEGVSGNGCRFPSALIGFNVEPPKDLEGTTLFLNNMSESDNEK